MADHEERLTERLMVQLSPRDLRELQAIADDWSAPWHGSPVGASGCTSPRSSKRRRRWPAVTTSSRRCSARPASAAKRGSKRRDGDPLPIKARKEEPMLTRENLAPRVHRGLLGRHRGDASSDERRVYYPTRWKVMVGRLGR